MNHKTSVTALVLSFLILSGVPPVFSQEGPGESETVVAAYQVRSGLLAGKVPAEHRQIWEALGTFVPPVLLNQVRTLEFFQTPGDQPEGAVATDGYASLNEDGESFTLGLNLDNARAAFVDKDPGALAEYRRTILHEFAHVLSFQAGQLDLTGTVRDSLVLDEGTLKPDSYLNQFHLRFWKKAYPGRDAATVGDAEGAAVYRKSPTSFVTEYAATGPLEDFAESFTVFVSEGKPAGKAVKDQKVRLFYSWPELVALRDQIRQGLAAGR